MLKNPAIVSPLNKQFFNEPDMNTQFTTHHAHHHQLR